jgi:purine-binding chemotaxis protein CheW
MTETIEQKPASLQPPWNGTISEGLSPSIQVVEFLLGKEHFAINLFEVREVVEYTRITKLPDSPPYIRGIIDLRGEITTIIDIKQQMNIPQESDSDEKDSRIIVLDDKITKSKIGIMVDDVLTVSTFTRSDVDSTSASGAKNDLIIGIIRKNVKVRDSQSTELIIWIDIRKLLRDNDQGIGES